VQAGPITLRAVRVLAAAEGTAPALLRGDRLRVEVDFDVTDEVPGLDLAVLVTAAGGARILDELLSDSITTRFTTGKYRVEVCVPALLNSGDYHAGVWFGTQGEQFLYEPAATPFTVLGPDSGRPERLVVLDLPFAVRRLDRLS
jgi:hypothetical protein